MAKLRKLSLAAGLLGLLSISLTAAYNSGFYLGVDLGPSHMYGDRTDTATNATPTTGTIADDVGLGSTKFAIGAHGGYVHRIDGCPWFVGIEVGGRYRPLSATVSEDLNATVGDSFDAELSSSWNFDIPVRLGWVFCDNYALYGLIGPSISRFEYKTTNSDDVSVSDCSTITGITYGIGVEHEFADMPFRLGLEVRNTNYGSKSFNTVETIDDVTHNIDAKINTFSVLLRAAYLF